MTGKHPFYPYACAVCYKFGSEMKVCEKCIMESYCGNRHQADHWPEHEEICKAIQQTRRSLNRKPLGPDTGYPVLGYLSLQKTFMLTLMQKLQRHLTTYEREMCLYSIKCYRICSASDGFLNCPNCASFSHCAEHPPYMDLHDKMCGTLKQCFYLDVINNGSNDKHVELDYLENINSRTAFRNMVTFASSYITSAKTKDDTMSDVAIIHSEYFTRPLTVLYGLELIKAEMEKPKTEKMHYSTICQIRPDIMSDNHEPKILDITSLVIHVIATDNTERITQRSWEVLFHFIKTLKDLSVIMIGPELGRETGYSAIEQQMCNVCRNKTLLFECHNVLYEDYVHSPLYKKPDLTVAFNAKFYDYTCGFLQDEEVWMRSIQAIANQNCPFIVTSSEVGDTRNSTEIRYKLNGLEPNISKANPYAGLRPHRLPDNETFSYSNSHIDIYTIFPKEAEKV